MKYTPNSSTSSHPAVQEIEKVLKELFPQMESSSNDFKELKEKIIKDISELVTNKQPGIEFDKEKLRPHIEDSIATHAFEKEFNKTLKEYTQKLDPKEQELLKQKIKDEMKALQKKGLNLIKNPEAHKIMIKLLVLKHCPKHKLKPGLNLVKETQFNLTKLKTECNKLLEKLKLTDPKLVPELTKILEKTFRDMEKNLRLEKEPKEEMSLLFRILTVFSGPSHDKEFDKLTPEQKVKIVTQGSDDGKYKTIPRNDIPMPDNIIVFPNTPAAAEFKPLYDVRELPTLTRDDKTKS